MTLRVFVADDSVTIQKIVKLTFSAEDAVVEAVSDGDSAIESLRHFKPDIVLADIFMPGCTGYEVCARIKEDPELKQVPVVLLVGTFEPFDEREASRVKSDAYLTKPFDTSELIQTVHRLAGNKVQEKTSTVGRGMVSAAARESFLGESRVLEVFDTEIASAHASAVAPGRPVEKPLSAASISEETLNAIVDRVIRKMSSEIIREVAWDVVPELSESIIRSTIKEQS